MYKIPYIGKIITLLSLWYGRTTWWQILVKVRKAFVVFNALIGVYLVYKTTGFNYDNLLAGFVGMGHTYLEIFINFNKKLFNWLVEFFDHKIVPNVPNNKPSSRWPFTINTSQSASIWPLSSPKPTDSVIDNLLNGPNSLRETYTKGGFNININTTPWYRDLSTWVWLGTIVGATAGIIGLSYIGYIYLADPISSLFKTTPVQPISPDGSITPTGVQPSGFKGTLTSYIFSPFKKLNPFNWFLASSEADAQFQRFMDKQNILATQDNRFYPFTQFNPHDSWFTRMRIHYFGETASENLTRLELRNKTWTELINLGMKSVQSVKQSPMLSSVGLTPNLPSGSLDFVGVSDWFKDTASKIASAPVTPGSDTPVNAPVIPNPFNEIVEAVNRLSNSPDQLLDNISASPITSPTVDASIQNRVDQLATPKSYSWVVSHDGKHN